MKRIGILFPLISGGGIFQYALSVADSLINHSPKYSYAIFHYGSENPRKFLKIKNTETTQFVCLDNSPNNFAGKLKLLLNVLVGKSIFTVNKKNKKIVKDIQVDLLIVPFPLLFGFEHNIPYVVSIQDVMHRYYPDFPEYPLMERIKRDIVFNYAAKHALFSIVDSQQGLQDLQTFYRVPKAKIRVLPFTPPGYIYQYQNMTSEEIAKTVRKYTLPEKFLFYPAQFWYHKNHLRLIKALKVVERTRGINIPLILVGSSANDKHYQEAFGLVKKLGLQDRIRHLGFVTDKEIVALYKRATALVFPTLIGPTSVPALEAMVLGTPVLCSNLFAMPEQIGDAGVLFDPFDVADIAEKVYTLWTDENLRKTVVQKGYARVRNLTLETYAQQWERVIDDTLRHTP